MSAEIVKGVTFAPGGTYTAGHFNDYIRNASISGIERSTVDSTVNVIFTRGSAAPPAPTTKEGFIDSRVVDLPETFIGGSFVAADPSAFRFGFNTGNGASDAGLVMQSSTTGLLSGVVFVGRSDGAGGAGTEANSNQTGGGDTPGVAIGVSETVTGLQRVFSVISGVMSVKVIGTCECGDFLTGQGSGTNGAAEVNNRDPGSGEGRAVGFATLPFVFAQALQRKTTSPIGSVLVKIFK